MHVIKFTYSSTGARRQNIRHLSKLMYYLNQARKPEERLEQIEPELLRDKESIIAFFQKHTELGVSKVNILFMQHNITENTMLKKLILFLR